MYKPSVEEIKKLRGATFAPMIQCKEALVSSEGDFKKALVWLNEKGLTKAASKSERTTGVGAIDSYIHNGSQVGVLLDLRCETDFVAKNEEFKKLSHDLCLQVASMNPTKVDDLLKSQYIRDPKVTISDFIKQTVAKVGENITVARFVRLALE